MVAVGSNLSAIIVGFKNFMQQASLCSSTEYLEIMYLEPEFNTINWGDTTDFDPDTLSTRIRIFSKMGIFFLDFQKRIGVYMTRIWIVFACPHENPKTMERR